MTLGRGGGLDEALYKELIKDGVPVNQATLIAAASINFRLTKQQKLFLAALSTDASGRYILNELTGVPWVGGRKAAFGKGGTMEDAVAWAVTGQGVAYIDSLYADEDQLNDDLTAFDDVTAKIAKLRALQTDGILGDAGKATLAELSLEARELIAALAPDVELPMELDGTPILDEDGIPIVPMLTTGNLRQTVLGEMATQRATAPLQDRGYRATGQAVPLTTQTRAQDAYYKAWTANQAVFKTELERQLADEEQKAIDATMRNFRGYAPPAQTTTERFAKEFGALPGGAGSPAFRQFAETAGPTLREQVTALPGQEQLPFLRRRFEALGPRDRGDYGTSNLAPPARFLSRR